MKQGAGLGRAGGVTSTVCSRVSNWLTKSLSPAVTTLHRAATCNPVSPEKRPLEALSTRHADTQSAPRHQHNVTAAFWAQHVHHAHHECAALQLQQQPPVPVISCKASIARNQICDSSFPLHHPHASVGLQLMQVQFRALDCVYVLTSHSTNCAVSPASDAVEKWRV